jgi:hypothetical protein
MSTDCALPGHGLEENLCGNCGSPLHLHVCALCQTVTSCSLCSQPFQVTQRRADYALPQIRPAHVVFHRGRKLDLFNSRVRAANAAAQRSSAAGKSAGAPQPPNQTELSRSASLSIRHTEMAPQPPAAALRPSRNLGNAATSKKWRSPLLLILVSGVAVAGYYAITPTVQTSPVSAMGNAGTITTARAGAPAAVGERLGEITQKPQLADRGARSQDGLAQKPGLRNAVSVAGSHSALPVQGNESEHAQPAATTDAAVAATAPVPLPVATERRPLRPRVAHAAIGSQAGSVSSGSSGVVNSQAVGEGGVPERAGNSASIATRADDGATVQCSTPSQALGLCDARTK